MVGSLGPVGGGAARNLAKTTAWYTSGLAMGSLPIAAVLILGGQVIESTRLLTFAQVALAAAIIVACLQVAGLPAVQLRRQVPDHWRGRMDNKMLAWLYGLLLGTGIGTAVVVSAFWVFFTMTLVVPPVAALLGWAAYALTRGVGFWAVSTIRGIDGIFLRPRARQLLVMVTTVVGMAAAMSHFQATAF